MRRLIHSIHTGCAPFSLLIVLMLFGVPITPDVFSAAMAADTRQATSKDDEKRLIGRWVRPDGGYILELRAIGKGGALKAAYFNPRPINIARAELQRRNGALTVSVELRDVNYPGSTYNLRFDPKTDQLVGTYFQAVERLTYDVVFVRAR